MSKIIRAINVMISKSHEISKIIDRNKEYFFIYDQKHKWSIKKRDLDKTCILFYYPGNLSIEELANLDQNSWESQTYITYSSKELKAREAIESLQELYRIVIEKYIGVDEALDDIIGDMPY